jgi:hypothetical protein
MLQPDPTPEAVFLIFSFSDLAQQSPNHAASGALTLQPHPASKAVFKLKIRRVLRHLLARLQPYIGLLPVRTITGKLAPASLFAHKICRAH